MRILFLPPVGIKECLNRQLPNHPDNHLASQPSASATDYMMDTDLINTMLFYHWQPDHVVRPVGGRTPPVWRGERQMAGT